jgi:hypothetical protein
MNLADRAYPESSKVNGRHPALVGSRRDMAAISQRSDKTMCRAMGNQISFRRHRRPEHEPTHRCVVAVAGAMETGTQVAR